jgi:hypothetical protein
MEFLEPTRSDRRRSAFMRGVCAFAIVLSFAFSAHAQTQTQSKTPRVALPVDPDDPGGGGVVPVPIGEGGWSRRPVSVIDEAGRPIETEIYQIEGTRGVALAPIPEVIRDQLIEEMAISDEGENVVFALNAAIIDEIERSLAMGQPTDALIDYANQDIDAVPYDLTRRGPFGSCSDGSFTKSKRLQYTPNFSKTENLGNGFSGTLKAEGAGNLDANGEIKLRVKRTRIFWVCVPYGVRFEHVRTVGSVTLDSTITLSGSIAYANPSPIEYEIAKPSLGGVGFLIGPLPVYIGFNLPITFGVEIKASVTGQLQYRGGASITGTFDYLCTASNCTGYNNLQTTTQNIANPFGAGVSGRIQPSLYADIGVRGFLYHEAVAYAQVGVRGYLHGDLWGYYGNTCGDADQNGHYETVSALTFGLNWQIAITAKADTFLTSTWKKTLWKSDEWYIGFWDLIGSSALTPMIDGPSSVGVGTAASYKIRMRPCWPYGDTINYAMDWGDGTTTSHSGSPAPPSWQPVLASRVWTTIGPKTMQLTALSDSHGRQFGTSRTTARLVQVTNAVAQNLATQALAVASSTYCSGAGSIHCYAPSRANDGDRSTALGGYTSWVNNNTVSMPQWLELQWGQLITISRIDLYTSSGYPIKDYDIQYWNGTTWINAASIRNNTALSLSNTIAPVQTFRLRILAFAGPAHQINHARINELEVY